MKELTKAGIARKLKRLRGTLSRREAAEKYGFNLRTLISWENQDRYPTDAALAYLKGLFRKARV